MKKEGKSTFEIQEEMYKKRKKEFEEMGGKSFEELVECSNKYCS